MDRIEGKHAVEELLRSGRRVSRIRIADGVRVDEEIERILELAFNAGIQVERVPRKQLDRDSERGAHQGVIAEAEPFRYADFGEVLASQAGLEKSLILALDHVTDPGNLGAVIRTADVVGAAGVLIPRDRSAGMTPSAFKAAAGAAERVAVAREANLVRALERAKESGFWVAGASEKGATVAWDAPLEGRLVLVFGAEDTGLSRLTERTCDLTVRLPMAGTIGSLNVSAAAAVLAYEWLRRTAS